MWQNLFKHIVGVVPMLAKNIFMFFWLFMASLPLFQEAVKML
jgi:hypothetical protein